MKIYMRKGDAWTPPRFWDFRVFDDDQPELIKEFKGYGYVPVSLSESEKERAKRCDDNTCWGDIGDDFNG